MLVFRLTIKCYNPVANVVPDFGLTYKLEPGSTCTPVAALVFPRLV
jgi:hypothetical protein